MLRTLRTVLIVVAVVIVAAAGALALVLSHGSPSGAPHAANATPGSRAASALNPALFCADWAVIPLAPSDGTPDLYGVAAISTSDVWAVGTSGDTRGVALHWNGVTWKRSQTPSLAGQVYLRGVAAASPTDVWAVGWVVTSQQGSTALIEHWNGSQWSVANTSNAASGQQNQLDAVAVVTSSDVWAVGTAGLTNTQPLMLHWNGATWTDVSSGPAPYASELSSVSGVAGNDVWAVGSSGGSGPSPLVEHWNGSRWQIVSAPQGPTGTSALNGVVARSSGDVWAVGYGVSFPAGISLTEHWNGNAWQVVGSPNPDRQGVNSLTAVAAVAGSETLWAVGLRGPELSVGSPPGARFLIEEWTGGAWEVVPGPNAPGAAADLYGVAATPSGDVWVVGSGGLTMMHTGPATRASLACPRA